MQSTLYEDVAGRVERLIDDGVLRPGQRVPSVRKLHSQWDVSISTVLEAYRLLEDRGVLEARPRSGHYVRIQGRRLPEPAPTAPPNKPTPIRISDNTLRMIHLAHRPGAVQLGAAVPDASLLPTEALNRLMGKVARKYKDAHDYSVSPGHVRLRRAVARRMVDAGCALSPDDVVVTNGAQEAVYLSLRAVTKPGDAVVIQSPAYFGVLETLELLGLRAIEVSTHPRTGVDLDALDSILAAERPAAVCLVPAFSNPLGSNMPDERKPRLVELLARQDTPLIEDDVYGELPFEGRRPKAVKAFDEHGLVLYCSSVSKTLSPGLRIGWAVPGRWPNDVSELNLVTSFATPTIPQLAVAEFFTAGGYDRHLRRLRRAYHDNVLRLTAAVTEHFPEGTRITRPTGGHVLWVELPEGVDSSALAEQAGAEGICVAPGVLFSPTRRYQRFIRLNAALSWTDSVQAAVRSLGRLTAEQLG